MKTLESKVAQNKEESKDYLKRLRGASKAITQLKEDKDFILLSSFEVNESLEKQQREMEFQIKIIGEHITHLI